MRNFQTGCFPELPGEQIRVLEFSAHKAWNVEPIEHTHALPGAEWHQHTHEWSLVGAGGAATRDFLHNEDLRDFHEYIKKQVWGRGFLHFRVASRFCVPHFIQIQLVSHGCLLNLSCALSRLAATVSPCLPAKAAILSSLVLQQSPTA